MAEVTVYMRIARTERGYRANARTSGPSHEPLMTDGYNRKVYPTAAFALVLDVPDELFDRAEQVLAEIEIPEDAATVAAEVTA